LEPLDKATPAFIGRATPKLGRAPLPEPPVPFRLPKALICFEPSASLSDLVAELGE
jgi:hypothetical protein